MVRKLFDKLYAWAGAVEAGWEHDYHVKRMQRYLFLLHLKGEELEPDFKEYLWQRVEESRTYLLTWECQRARHILQALLERNPNLILRVLLRPLRRAWLKLQKPIDLLYWAIYTKLKERKHERKVRALLEGTEGAETSQLTTPNQPNN